MCIRDRLLFALGITNTPARIGMGLGWLVTLMIVIGLGIGIPRLRSALKKGGTALATTQMIPLVQLFAGMIAIRFSIEIGLAVDYSDDNPAGFLFSTAAGFTCTVITATLLAGLAAMAGFLFSR